MSIQIRPMVIMNNQNLACPFAAEIIDLSPLGGSIYALRVRVVDDYTFKAGQYCYLSLMDDGDERRAYSIAGASDDGCLEFHIRDGGQGFCAQLRANVANGERALWLSAPEGDMQYVEDCTHDLVLIAGGTGYAPIRAILLELARCENSGRDVEVYIGARDVDALYMRDELKAFESRINRLLVRYAVESIVAPNMTQGSLLDLLLAEAATFVDKRLYIAGPPAMVLDIHDFALNNNASEHMVHWDKANIQRSVKAQ